MRPLFLLIILSLLSAGCLGSDDAGEGLDAAAADTSTGDTAEGAADAAAAGTAAADEAEEARAPVTETFSLMASLHAPGVSDMREVAKVVTVPQGAVAVRVEVHWTPSAPTAERLHGMVHDTTEDRTMLVGVAGPSPLTLDVAALGNLTEVNVMAHGTDAERAVMVNQEVHYAATFFFDALDPAFTAFSDA